MNNQNKREAHLRLWIHPLPLHVDMTVCVKTPQNTKLSAFLSYGSLQYKKGYYKIHIAVYDNMNKMLPCRTNAYEQSKINPLLFIA